jgi:hypothetical protein
MQIIAKHHDLQSVYTAQAAQGFVGENVMICRYRVTSSMLSSLLNIAKLLCVFVHLFCSHYRFEL